MLGFTAVFVAVSVVVIFRRWIKGPSYSSPVRLTGKTAIITGGSNGVGKETARDFSRRGARVILACRDVKKAEAAAQDIRAETGGDVIVYKLDLASLKSVRECAREILSREAHIHILVNNAGISGCLKGSTEDGFETHFGVNHLGHFLFTNLLLRRILQSGPARIVNLTSSAYDDGRINFCDINLDKKYTPALAYANSRLANVLFTREMARRLQGTSVTTYSVHPGMMAADLDRFLNSTLFGLNWLCNLVAWSLLKTPKEAAQTILYCALDSKLDNISGRHYSDCSEAHSSMRALDVAIAKRLWDVSGKMVELDSNCPCEIDAKSLYGGKSARSENVESG